MFFWKTFEEKHMRSKCGHLCFLWVFFCASLLVISKLYVGVVFTFCWVHSPKSKKSAWWKNTLNGWINRVCTFVRRWSNLIHIFQVGCFNHQLRIYFINCPKYREYLLSKPFPLVNYIMASKSSKRCCHQRISWLRNVSRFLGQPTHSFKDMARNLGDEKFDQMGVSENRCTPKSSILIGFSIINHPFWGTTIFGNTQMMFRKFDHNPTKQLEQGFWKLVFFLFK